MVTIPHSKTRVLVLAAAVEHAVLSSQLSTLPGYQTQGDSSGLQLGLVPDGDWTPSRLRDSPLYGPCVLPEVSEEVRLGISVCSDFCDPVEHGLYCYHTEQDLEEAWVMDKAKWFVG
jgi:hypothetical protein